MAFVGFLLLSILTYTDSAPGWLTLGSTQKVISLGRKYVCTSSHLSPSNETSNLFKTLLLIPF